MRNLSRSLLLLLAFFLIGASAQAQSMTAPASQPQSAATPAKNDYSKGETWLCRPGRQDACTVDLTTTVDEVYSESLTGAFAGNYSDTEYGE